MIRRVGLRYPRQGLGPFKSRAFACAVERRFAPGIEQIEALFSLAMLARAYGVHVQARLAAINLRGADFHQFHQAVLQTALQDSFAVVEPGLHGCRRSGERVQSRFHRHLLCEACSHGQDEMDWAGCDMPVQFFAGAFFAECLSFVRSGGRNRNSL
jgi:hypothetical protein